MVQRGCSEAPGNYSKELQQGHQSGAAVEQNQVHYGHG